MLDMRLSELYNVVDTFLLLEAPTSFSQSRRLSLVFIAELGANSGQPETASFCFSSIYSLCCFSTQNRPPCSRPIRRS